MIEALDVNAARYGIERDIHEILAEGWLGWALLAIVFSLPAISLLALLARRWLALLPLALSLGLAALWFSYYATDWIGPQSGPGMFWLGTLFVLSGWVLFLIALRWPRPTRAK